MSVLSVIAAVFLQQPRFTVALRQLFALLLNTPSAFQKGKHIPAIIVRISDMCSLLIAVETKATGDQFQGSTNNVS